MALRVPSGPRKPGSRDRAYRKVRVPARAARAGPRTFRYARSREPGFPGPEGTRSAMSARPTLQDILVLSRLAAVAIEATLGRLGLIRARYRLKDTLASI